MVHVENDRPTFGMFGERYLPIDLSHAVGIRLAERTVIEPPSGRHKRRPEGVCVLRVARAQIVVLERANVSLCGQALVDT